MSAKGLRLLLAPLLVLASPALAAPEFTGGPEFASDTGHVLLSWESDEPVRLIIADNAEFSGAKPLYEGSQTSFFVSGLSNGEYYLRLDGVQGESSQPAKLNVVHQSLTQAIWLTIIGLIITVGIIATIARGARDD